MAQTLICQPVAAEARVQYQANICGICGGQITSEEFISPSISIFLCQYDSTDVPCSFIHLSLTV